MSKVQAQQPIVSKGTTLQITNATSVKVHRVTREGCEVELHGRKYVLPMKVVEDALDAQENKT